MTDSAARTLLDLAARAKDQLKKHLFVAAALGEQLADEPIVVGGTAEEYWTADAYQETDLDLCAPITAADEARLDRLGFKREGRHWVNDTVGVAVEFPDSRIDGDEARAVRERVGPGTARIIGLEDLYLDRLRRATATEPVQDLHFYSALAVAAAGFDSMDWRYVAERMRGIVEQEPTIAESMRRVNRRVRAIVRRRLSTSD